MESLCELGIYSTYLGDGEGHCYVNQYAGYLLRVKPSSADEGGVAAGFAVLGTPSLV